MSVESPTIPILSGNKPYLGTPANRHAEYLAAANSIATSIDQIYSRMIGADRGGRDNKPLMIRDAEDFTELRQSIREAEKQLNIVAKTYKLGQFKDADDIVNKAKQKFYGLVQTEYLKIKTRINNALNWEEQLGPYRREQLQKATTANEEQVKSDKATVANTEKYLFKF